MRPDADTIFSTPFVQPRKYNYLIEPHGPRASRTACAWTAPDQAQERGGWTKGRDGTYLIDVNLGRPGST